ncbi:pantoate--beta-alanine ligase [Gillisia sp. Hel_I_86]|uniref:pantoate--beta-alanine ligase n=1 Tax=Gillisia sp. Hel_I_86 TaxID=1249981 RepID=UPI00119B50C4|nr:pantoate--beta-alanine ligase [Gillisia sp. Hel_I_86]TVZ26463.1 pantoate--beta-alanine ligase [Gillisia sp. Hel_I_86]
MQIIKEKATLTEVISKLKSKDSSIGFVPTMGALHEGHLSLIRQAAAVCDVVVVSIFINPTQFDNAIDLDKYPRTLDSDIQKLEELNLNVIGFTPSAAELYSNNIQSEHFQFDGLEHKMEGKYRNGHFDGVGTVIKKLFEMVQPDKAFFGEKDYQQLQIIKKLVQCYQLPVEVIACPINREHNGLARSSRNERLIPKIRLEASFIHETLLKAKDKFGIESANQITQWVENEFKAHPYFKLEYFEIADSETLKPITNDVNGKLVRAFIAVYFEDIRLIDNIALNY